MTCDKHVDVEVGLAEVKTELKAVSKGQDVLLQEFRDYIASQKVDIDNKISKFTFILVVTIFTGIISYIAVDIKDLKAEIVSAAKKLEYKGK